MPAPLPCPFCGQTSDVRTERTIRGTSSTSSYSCPACGRSWNGETSTAELLPSADHDPDYPARSIDTSG